VPAGAQALEPLELRQQRELPRMNLAATVLHRRCAAGHGELLVPRHWKPLWPGRYPRWQLVRGPPALIQLPVRQPVRQLARQPAQVLVQRKRSAMRLERSRRPAFPQAATARRRQPVAGPGEEARQPRPDLQQVPRPVRWLRN